jgi:aquaporin Z
MGGKALEQLWLFILAPLIGAAVAGFLFRVKLLSAEE